MKDKIKREYEELVRQQEEIRVQRANMGLENQANNSSDEDLCFLEGAMAIVMGVAGIGLAMGAYNVYNDYIQGGAPFFKYAKDFLRPSFCGLGIGILWGFGNYCVGTAMDQCLVNEQTDNERGPKEQPVVK